MADVGRGANAFEVDGLDGARERPLEEAIGVRDWFVVGGSCGDGTEEDRPPSPSRTRASTVFSMFPCMPLRTRALRCSSVNPISRSRTIFLSISSPTPYSTDMPKAFPALYRGDKSPRPGDRRWLIALS